VAELFVKRADRGPRVVLVHGAVLASTALCWRQQLPLAERFALEVVDRAGYGHNQRLSPGEDLDADAPLVAGLLADGAQTRLCAAAVTTFYSFRAHLRLAMAEGPGPEILPAGPPPAGRAYRPSCPVTCRQSRMSPYSSCSAAADAAAKVAWTWPIAARARSPDSKVLMASSANPSATV
jgi:hypothetical protein